MNANPQTPQKPSVLRVGVDIRKLMPVDFDLVDIDKTGRVTPNGVDQGVDVSGLKQVKLEFSLQDNKGLQFPRDAHRCIGIREESLGCPEDASNSTKGMFEHPEVSDDQRTLSVLDHNSGNDDKYRFALFVVDGNGTVASCDPRIVNN